MKDTWESLKEKAMGVPTLAKSSTLEEIPQNVGDTFFRIAGYYLYGYHSLVVAHIREYWPILAPYDSFVGGLLAMKAASLKQLRLIPEAFAALRELVEKRPDDANARMELQKIWVEVYELLEHLYDLKAWRRLKEVAETAVEADADNDVVSWYLGVALDETGDPKAAEGIFKTLTERVPNSESYWQARVRSLRHQGKIQEAIKVCTEASDRLAEQGRDAPGIAELLDYLEWMANQDTPAKDPKEQWGTH